MIIDWLKSLVDKNQPFTIILYPTNLRLSYQIAKLFFYKCTHSPYPIGFTWMY